MNPGPTFKILKVIKGSFHQGHPKFGQTAGIRCGTVAERLRYRSREQKVPSSSPRSDISVEVTSQC